MVTGSKASIWEELLSSSYSRGAKGKVVSSGAGVGDSLVLFFVGDAMSVNYLFGGEKEEREERKKVLNEYHQGSSHTLFSSFSSFGDKGISILLLQDISIDPYMNSATLFYIF